MLLRHAPELRNRQANFGAARDLKIGGHPFGRMMVEEGFHGEAKLAAEREHGSYGEKLHEGSILIVLGTDAPMLPHQLARLCKCHHQTAIDLVTCNSD